MSTSQSSTDKRSNSAESTDWVMYVRDRIDEFELDAYEFRVYAHVVRRTGGKRNREFFAKLNKTAEICKMSVRRVQYSLRILCAAGLLVEERRVGQPSIYRLTPQESWKNKEDLPQIRAEVTGKKQKAEA